MSKKFYGLLICICVLFYTWLPLILEDVVSTSHSLKVLAVLAYVIFLLFCLWIILYRCGRDPQPFYPDEV